MRFSPKRTSPARTASGSLSAGTVLVASHKVISAGSRPALRQAFSIRSCKSASRCATGLALLFMVFALAGQVKCSSPQSDAKGRIVRTNADHDLIVQLLRQWFCLSLLLAVTFGRTGRADTVA